MKYAILFFAFAAVFSMAAVARAGTISGMESGTDGWAAPSTTDDKTNTGYTSNGNFSWLTLTLDDVKPATATFDVADSGGMTQYDFLITIVNESETTWDGLEVRLAFGPADNTTPADGHVLDLNSLAPMPAAVFFTNASGDLAAHTASLLSWPDAPTSPGFFGQGMLEFSINVGDLDAGIVPAEAVNDDGNGYLITLEIVPTVAPEPTAWALLMVGGLPLLLGRRRWDEGVKG